MTMPSPSAPTRASATPSKSRLPLRGSSASARPANASTIAAIVCRRSFAQPQAARVTGGDQRKQVEHQDRESERDCADRAEQCPGVEGGHSAEHGCNPAVPRRQVQRQAAYSQPHDQRDRRQQKAHGRHGQRVAAAVIGEARRRVCEREGNRCSERESDAGQFARSRS
jgi:hypothetical protein